MTHHKYSRHCEGDTTEAVSSLNRYIRVRSPSLTPSSFARGRRERIISPLKAVRRFGVCDGFRGGGGCFYSQKSHSSIGHRRNKKCSGRYVEHSGVCAARSDLYATLSELIPLHSQLYPILPEIVPLHSGLIPSHSEVYPIYSDLIAELSVSRPKISCVPS